MLRHSQIGVPRGGIHVVEAGSSDHPPVLFLHGWPEDWSAFEKILSLAGEQVHAIAVDLPGIGDSKVTDAPLTKKEIAACIHDLVVQMRLEHLTLVGHDIGGQVVYSYLRSYAHELDRAVIMNVATPGVRPWEDVIRNPHIWHFAFHNVPGLPETIVSGRERSYFDYFYAAIAAHPEKITNDARNRYAEAYSTPSALSTGFGWYRAFGQDAKNNRDNMASGTLIDVPLLYLRGEHEGGNTEQYIIGFKEAGMVNVHRSLIRDSGHFAPEEQPEEVWKCIADFLGNDRSHG